MKSSMFRLSAKTCGWVEALSIKRRHFKLQKRLSSRDKRSCFQKLFVTWNDVSGECTLCSLIRFRFACFCVSTFSLSVGSHLSAYHIADTDSRHPHWLYCRVGTNFKSYFINLIRNLNKGVIGSLQLSIAFITPHAEIPNSVRVFEASRGRRFIK